MRRGVVIILGNSTIGRDVQIYDPESDRWRRGANMPSTLHHMGAASANGKLYVVGGYVTGFNPIDTMFEYDPVSDSWTAKTRLPAARGGLAACSYRRGSRHCRGLLARPDPD